MLPTPELPWPSEASAEVAVMISTDSISESSPISEAGEVGVSLIAPLSVAPGERMWSKDSSESAISSPS